MPRIATIGRKTNETDTRLRLNLDGRGTARIRQRPRQGRPQSRGLFEFCPRIRHSAVEGVCRQADLRPRSIQ